MIILLKQNKNDSTVQYTNVLYNYRKGQVLVYV